MHAVVFVCPFKVYLILVYTRISLLSSTILNYFYIKALLLKIIIDKSVIEVYNSIKNTQGGFYIDSIHKYPYPLGYTLVSCREIYRILHPSM